MTEELVAYEIMTVVEAQECVKKINLNIQDTRVLLLDLYERKGWEALGYESWRSCVVAEFKGKENYLYKQMAAAQTERNICTMVQKDEPISERVLRPLASLPPEEQREVYQEAVATAPEGKVTAGWVEQVVKGNIEGEGDSYILMTLKQYWKKATKKDKKLFIEWSKGGA